MSAHLALRVLADECGLWTFSAAMLGLAAVLIPLRRVAAVHATVFAAAARGVLGATAAAQLFGPAATTASTGPSTSSRTSRD